MFLSDAARDIIGVGTLGSLLALVYVQAIKNAREVTKNKKTDTPPSDAPETPSGKVVRFPATGSHLGR
jgi:hypothetical protein